MKIRTSLLLAVLASVLMAVVAGVASFCGHRTAKAAQHQARAIESVIHSINELNGLIGSYLLDHEERPCQQFLAEHDQLTERLTAVQLHNAEQRQILDSIRENGESMKAAFLELMTNFEMTQRNADDVTLQRAGARMAGQLQVKARQAVADSVRLQRLVNDQLTSTQTTVSGLVLFLIFAVAAAVTVVLLAMMQSVAASLATLRQGTAAVGTGNLAHRIGLSGGDELAALARSFDRMTEKLHAVTVSKKELELEVRERRQAEDSLRQSEERFRRFMAHSPTIAWMKDDQGRYVYLSKKSEKRLGVRWEGFRGKTDAELWPAEIAAEFRQNDRAVLETGKPLEVTEETVNPDGSRSYWLSSKFPFRDAAGNLYVAGIGLDITERKRSEAALRASEERFELAARGTGVGIWDWDFRTGKVYYSPGWKMLFGYEKCEIGESIADWSSLLHPEERESILKLQNDFLADTSLSVSAEYRLRHNDGSYRWIVAHGVVVRDEAGKTYRFVGSHGDVTARKQAEQELHESEQRLRASLGEKEVLLKEIHHRVKNNMQVISSLVALQAERVPETAMRAVLQDVTHRVRSMALVHEKLYQSTDLSQVEFADYARSLLNYLWRAHAAAATGVRLVLDLEQVPIAINAAVPCGLILNELVSNSLKHSFRDGAGGEVAVSLHKDPDGQVCLRVRDNGTGMPAEFDWRQADSLGLHLVQVLAGQLHAAVEVSSGQGTEFVVKFCGPGRSA